jgi:hypothetical protein
VIPQKTVQQQQPQQSEGPGGSGSGAAGGGGGAARAEAAAGSSHREAAAGGTGADPQLQRSAIVERLREDPFTAMLAAREALHNNPRSGQVRSGGGQGRMA